MTRIDTRDLLREAHESGRGVGAFNVLHLETAEGLVAAAERTGLPVILQISQNLVRFHGGLRPVAAATMAIAEQSSARVAVHLDHAEDVGLAREAIDLGFDSVMYDGAKLPWGQNVATTADIVDYAHSCGVGVEAELGEIGGKEGAHAPGVRTDPGEARRFVEATGVDALAVAVGSSHAMIERTAELDLDLIGQLREAVPAPLVLHGSSGVSDSTIQAAIAAGIVKVNVSTHLNKVFTGALREFLDANPAVVDSRKYLAPARAALSDEAGRLLELFARV